MLLLPFMLLSSIWGELTPRIVHTAATDSLSDWAQSVPKV